MDFSVPQREIFSNLHVLHFRLIFSVDYDRLTWHYSPYTRALVMGHYFSPPIPPFRDDFSYLESSKGLLLSSAEGRSFLCLTHLNPIFGQKLTKSANTQIHLNLSEGLTGFFLTEDQVWLVFEAVSCKMFT